MDQKCSVTQRTILRQRHRRKSGVADSRQRSPFQPAVSTERAAGSSHPTPRGQPAARCSNLRNLLSRTFGCFLGSGSGRNFRSHLGLGRSCLSRSCFGGSPLHDRAATTGLYGSSTSRLTSGRAGRLANWGRCLSAAARRYTRTTTAGMLSREQTTVTTASTRASNPTVTGTAMLGHAEASTMGTRNACAATMTPAGIGLVIAAHHSDPQERKEHYDPKQCCSIHFEGLH